MKKVGKRKIIILLAILTLCIIIFTAVFLKLQSWLHSDGMHFIGRYGQVHISQTCEGIDQDGNKIEPRKVVIDGTVTIKEVYTIEGEGNRGSGEFDGVVNIEGLPEVEKYGLFPAGESLVVKFNTGLLFFPCYTFGASDFTIREHWNEEEEGSSYSSATDIWCNADVWIKDNQIGVKFFQGQGKEEDKYYIFYSDKEMLDLPELENFPRVSIPAVGGWND